MMNKFNLIKSILLLGCLAFTNTYAQLSSNPDKFLGNITTRGQVNGTGFEYASLWNQITPENESKWSSIEGTRGSFNWNGCDNAYNYAKNHKFPFKFHTLVWGSQYPSWMDKLSKEEQYKEIVKWMDAIKNRYPNLEMIDVVNEAVAGHAPAPYKEALGGDGKTGYDWIIKAFEMAYERWPNAILIYNDYNTFQWQKTEFINLVKTLRDAGAPIDAYGCQSHDLTDMNFSSFKSAMTEIQNALKMPMYSTEYDIGTTDDAKQKQQYMDQIKYMWEQDYVAGITLWGYIYGATWTTDGNSGIIKNGKDRPAMTWLREYMASDAAKTAKSPFPGFKKEASVYVAPKSINSEVNVPTEINIRARLRTKTIDHVELYINNVLTETLTEAPYIVQYTPTKTGKLNLKAIVYDTEGNKYERLSGINVHLPRKPFKGEGIDLPGTIEAENFDTGSEGITYHDSNTNKEGDAASYRNDGGIDIVKCTGGYAIGYTNSGEWMEYTVNVKEAGYYDYDLVASAGGDNAKVSISLSGEDGIKTLASNIAIPKNSYDTYKKLHGRFAIPLEEGKQIIRIIISNNGCNVDKLVLKHVDVDKNIKLAIKANPSPATVNENTTLTFDASSSTSEISSVTVYVNDILLRTLSTAPFETTYKATAAGTYSIKAVATDADGKVSNIVEKTLTVNKKRSPYKSVIQIPGTIEAENFDKCGEGVSFHDSDSQDEGKANYRTDNEGVDIVKGNNGYVIGYTAANEWLEYTVNVTDPGKYSYEAVVSSGSDGSGFTLALVKDGKTTNITNKINVPNGGSWDTYKTVKGNLIRSLEAGEQVIRITINGAYCNIDKIKLICTLSTGVEEVVELANANYSVYTTTGVYVGKITADRSNVAEQIYHLTGKHGIFIIKDANTGKSKKIMTSSK